MSGLSVYIIAFNEEDKIEDAVKSVLWADEVVVIDSYSNDRTVERAEKLGARVEQVFFKGFGDLRNRAIAACGNDWIFSLDADERCTTKAKEEIESIIRFESALDLYHVPRKNLFMGKHIRHSGYYPDYRQPQLFRKGAMTFEDDQVHERYVMHTDKPVGYMKEPIWQIPFKDLEQILHKANRYSSLGALKLETAGKQVGMMTAFGHGVWAFIVHYFLKLGFLDGWPGFVIALANFEGTFYKYAKLCEKQSAWRFEEAQRLIRDELPFE